MQGSFLHAPRRTASRPRFRNALEKSAPPAVHSRPSRRGSAILASCSPANYFYWDTNRNSSRAFRYPERRPTSGRSRPRGKKQTGRTGDRRAPYSAGRRKKKEERNAPVRTGPLGGAPFKVHLPQHLGYPFPLHFRIREIFTTCHAADPSARFISQHSFSGIESRCTRLNDRVFFIASLDQESVLTRVASPLSRRFELDAR